jgi:hypothetical protein
MNDKLTESAIDELHRISAAIDAVADSLTSEVHEASAQESTAKESMVHIPTAEEPVVQEPVPPTLEQVRAVLAEKSRAGHTAEIRELLKKYGVTKLSAINPEHYADLIKEAGTLHE